MQPASWPDRIRQEIAAPQEIANREAADLERAGQPDAGMSLRIFGRLNGIENALITLSKQIQEHDASRR